MSLMVITNTVGNPQPSPAALKYRRGDGSETKWWWVVLQDRLRYSPILRVFMQYNRRPLVTGGILCNSRRKLGACGLI